MMSERVPGAGLFARKRVTPYPLALVACLLWLLAGGYTFARAQAPPDPTQSRAPQPNFTLRTESRVVLTDVLVTDKDGNPVHGLQSTDFQIFDNKKKQTLSSFEEHTTEQAKVFPTMAGAPGEYSNDFMLHLPPVLNVMVIDIKNLELADQMYLAYELKRFVQQLPAGEPLAMYWCDGPRTVLLQSFTADHTLLLAAVQRAVPHFPPHGRVFLNDADTLYQIATDLAQVPGRKNVLWFTGGSTLFLRPDTFALDSQNAAALRDILDQLETSRIAIYPVDARGLVIDAPRNMWQQQGQMRDIAEATGGIAYYNNNGLDRIAGHLLNNDGSFYTLTYTPTDFTFDNKWHKVQVKLADGHGKVTLSYRRGYYADAHEPPAAPGSTGSEKKTLNARRRLLSGGGAVEEHPDQVTTPIIFKVKLLPITDASQAGEPQTGLPAKPEKVQKGTALYSALYTMPRDGFTARQVGATSQIEANVMLIAFNNVGSVIARQGNHLTFTTTGAQPGETLTAPLTFSLRVSLPKGETNILCAVWDTTSRRVGTLQIPITVTDKTSH
jgi:VWFA-related protein